MPGNKSTDKGFPFVSVIMILCCLLLWLLAFRYWSIQERTVLKPYRNRVQTLTQIGGHFCDGIYVDDVCLDGMTLQEAKELFRARNHAKERALSMVIKANGKKWNITSQEIPLLFDAESILDRAFMIGHTGTLEQRLSDIEGIGGGMHFNTEDQYSIGRIDGLVRTISASVNKPATNAAVDAFDPITRTFTFKKETAGWELDRDDLSQQIKDALTAGSAAAEINARGEEVAPEVRESDLIGRFGLIASYSTKTTADRDRNTNISLSAQALNGRAVQPGESLSFNSCTGKRTGDKGYREAGAIAGGVLVDDTGGGVCQTSSTLFNAVVRADLEIVKRYAHSWPSSYVPRGEDATVNWPSRDFVFRNTGEYPVVIMANYEKNEVTVEVYGELSEEWDHIDLRSETIKTIKPSNDTLYTLDESLPPGTRQAGRSKHTGYVVDTYKVYLDAEGNELRRVKLWTTNYPATQNEILYH